MFNAYLNLTLSQRVELILVSYLGDADLYANVGASKDFPSPGAADYSSAHSTAIDRIVVGAGDPKFVAADGCNIAVGAGYACPIKITVYGFR